MVYLYKRQIEGSNQAASDLSYGNISKNSTIFLFLCLPSLFFLSFFLSFLLSFLTHFMSLLLWFNLRSGLHTIALDASLGAEEVLSSAMEACEVRTYCTCLLYVPTVRMYSTYCAYSLYVRVRKVSTCLFYELTVLSTCNCCITSHGIRGIGMTLHLIRVHALALPCLDLPWLDLPCLALLLFALLMLGKWPCLRLFMYLCLFLCIVFVHDDNTPNDAMPVVSYNYDIA